MAESVRVRLRPFEADGFPELEQNLRRIPWHAYLRRNDAFTLSVTSHGSRLYHTDAISERVTRIIQTCIGSRAQAPSERLSGHAAHASIPQKFHVRVHRNVVQVSVDASGERLHRRGYRTHVPVAPLRETLAAAMVRLLHQRFKVPMARLWDPCCGSGTLLAEWLIYHRGSIITPRTYAFEHWPINDHAAYKDWLARYQQSLPTADGLRAYGSDIDPRSIDAARHNLEHAKVFSNCQLFAEDFRTVAKLIPSDTSILSNLPYGVRLTDAKAAARLFQALDELLSKRLDLRPAVILLATAHLPPTRCEWEAIARFANGGLRVTAWSIR